MAFVLRRDAGGMWTGAGVPRGSCDNALVLCDAHERALPSWLGFNSQRSQARRQPGDT